MKATKKWKIKSEIDASKLGIEGIVKVLLENRGITGKKEIDNFLSPVAPGELKLSDVGIDPKSVAELVTRFKKAKKGKELILVYGDYDTDGICATAILWECLHKLGFKALPHIPDRFDEGYGLNAESIEKLKQDNPQLKLIITVDNGIVANDAVAHAAKLGVDVVITDHHQKAKKVPSALSIIHTTQIGGAAIAWFVARELQKRLGAPKPLLIDEWLALAAIGTVADIIALTGANRSIVKFGLIALQKTKRVGLNKLIDVTRIEKSAIGTYEIGFVLAPRINAMGRLKQGIEALRLLCTTDPKRAASLARLLNSTNFERIGVVETVVAHAKNKVSEGTYSIVLAHKSYHEGVIGLAASELVKKHHRPAIVLAKGKDISKASARSIVGFDIIAAIRGLESLIEGGGGHPMAAGFSIKTKNIEKFTKKFESVAKEILTPEMLERSLIVDLEIGFASLDLELLASLQKLEPFGNGNPEPVFVTKNVNVVDFRTVGKEGTHLKLYLENGGKKISAIAFGMGKLALKLKEDVKVNIAYNIFANTWNGNTKLELRLKDLEIEK